jgi:ubiquinone/menaquinone biosynthesis C-methylase UbiE
MDPMGFNKENNICLDPSLHSDIILAPLIGESIWHVMTNDPSILAVSSYHYERILRDLRTYLPNIDNKKLRVLEVGAYAHISGYMLAHEIGCSVTLFDLSSSTLRQGYNLAIERGLDHVLVKRIAGDFHELPFDNQAFDVVYLCSTLHHTWRWQQVLSELIRVVASNGILIMDNELCRREFCFYNFRHNRVEQLSYNQKIFEKYEIIKTVGEPFGGSRPEMIFGMIENHEIPLDNLLSKFYDKCKIEDLMLTQPQMNSFEQEADRAFCQGAVEARRFIVQDFAERLNLAHKELTELNGGPATPVPDENAVAAMAIKIGHLIETYGYGESSRLIDVSNLTHNVTDTLTLDNFLPKNPELYRKITQSRIFGSAVRIVARRNPATMKELQSSTAPNRPKISPEQNGISSGFSDQILVFMNNSRSLLPALQSLNEQTALIELGNDWKLISHGVFSVLLAAVNQPEILIKNNEIVGNYLIAFRLQVSYADTPWQLHLSVNSLRYCWVDVLQSESTLLVASIPNIHGPLKVKFTPTLMDGRTQVIESSFSLSQALAFRIS